MMRKRALVESYERELRVERTISRTTKMRADANEAAVNQWGMAYTKAIAERDSARNVAVRLEQELAELRRQYGLDS